MIELLWNGPISEERMGRIVDALPVDEGSRMLDVGCGCGEVLIRVAERHGVVGIGVDHSAAHVAEAERRARERGVDTAVRFEVADGEGYEVEPGSLDLVMCLGSTHAFGLGADAYANALERMMPMVREGGSILVADGYAIRPADPEYRRRFLGETTPDTMTHAANVSTGSDLGLVPLAAWTSSVDEWDEFEWGYQRIVERRARASPDDQDALDRLVRRREWMDGYLRWGRDTLGYGIYLFRRPDV